MGFFGHLGFFGEPPKCEVAHTSFRLAPLKSGMAKSIWRQLGRKHDGSHRGGISNAWPRRRKERRRNSSPAKTKRRSGPRNPWTKSGGDRTGNPHPDFGESNFFATQPNEVTQLSCGRDVDRATLLKVVERSMKIDGQYDRDTGAMLFQLHRYIETWVGPRCPEYEGGWSDRKRDRVRL